MERIEKLINHIIGTDKSLRNACEELGFSIDDLSNLEFAIFEDKVGRCSDCQKWHWIEDTVLGYPGRYCDNCWADYNSGWR